MKTFRYAATVAFVLIVAGPASYKPAINLSKGYL